MPRSTSLFDKARYVEVADLLRQRVLDGSYEPGERLPRQHDLARECGVAFGTLKHSLDILESEGYVVRKAGMGTYATLPDTFRPVGLVVDDEGDFREFLARAFASIGWEGVAVDSGEEALAELASRRFDVVLLDLVMPGMSGVETFREIRRLEPDAYVVIVTGYPDSDLMAEALQIGPFGVMRKPVTLQELRVVLSHALGGVQITGGAGSASRPS